VKRQHPVPDRILRDSRRDTWILVVPAEEFIAEEFASDARPPHGSALQKVVLSAPRYAERPLGPSERVLPWLMLVWAFVAWTFIIYDLSHN